MCEQLLRYDHTQTRWAALLNVSDSSGGCLGSSPTTKVNRFAADASRSSYLELDLVVCVLVPDRVFRGNHNLVSVVPGLHPLAKEYLALKHRVRGILRSLEVDCCTCPFW